MRPAAPLAQTLHTSLRHMTIVRLELSCQLDALASQATAMTSQVCPGANNSNSVRCRRQGAEAELGLEHPSCNAPGGCVSLLHGCLQKHKDREGGEGGHRGLTLAAGVAPVHGQLAEWDRQSGGHC